MTARYVYPLVIPGLYLLSHTTFAAKNAIEDLLGLSLSQLTHIPITLGTRGDGHNMMNSPVPVEVITAEAIERTGFGELGKALQRLLPSFNFPRAALADGTDHARPFTLRGMGTDQVLVLINGKRRHSGALLHVNSTIGRGSSGVDINMIPIHAVERIEVMRDGAAAQYGSDAIAGIINIILKQDLDEQISLRLGQTREGDGALRQLSLSTGHKLGKKGFVHLSAELRQREATNRSGLDTRQQYFADDPRNQQAASITHQLGDAALDDALVMLNAEFSNDDIDYYSHASLGYREGESTGFFRRPLDNRNVRSIYPDGFLPQITPEIMDMGLSIGAKSETDSGWQWDSSYTFGLSDFNFNVSNSLNASLGTASPRQFDSGSLKNQQHMFNLDLFKALDMGWRKPLDLGLGLEIRQEQFTIKAGEANSYLYGGINVLDGPNQGSITAAGAQVFPGFRPSNAVSAKRHNISMYADLEYAFSKKLLGQAALRYERYSDFGSTLTAKLASAYNFNKAWVWRNSASTGFRAPSLSQSHFTSTATVFVDNNIPVEVGTFSVTHPLAQALGATDLSAEKSLHFSSGFSYQPNKKFLFSLDYFFTEIKDRIVLSGDIYQNAAAYGQASVDALQRYNVLGARFFSNAIDTQTQGLDISAKYELALSKGQRLNFSAQYHVNKTRIIGAVRSPTILGVNGAEVVLDRSERVQRVESGQPSSSIILNALYQYRDWDINLRLQRFGSYQLVNYLDDPSYDQNISAKWLTDLDVTYHLSKRFSLSAGVHNLFDVYPDANLGKDTDSFSGAGKIIPYSPNSPFGYNGAFYYLRGNYLF